MAGRKGSEKGPQSGESKERSNNWMRDETLALLKILREPSIKKGLMTDFHNAGVYKRIVQRMEIHGHNNRDSGQCKTKVGNLICYAKKGNYPKNFTSKDIELLKSTLGHRINNEASR